MQYAHNYGAMLQGYALKTYLEKLGHHVSMVDHRHSDLTRWAPRSIAKKSIKSVLLYPKYLLKWYLPTYIPKKLREYSFESFLKKYLNCDNSIPDNQLDVIIYGSDQIWSKFNNGFDLVWWGLEHDCSIRKITYAVSMGIIDIDIDDEPFIKKALSGFSAISVREDNLLHELVERNLVPKSKICRVIDPVFLLDRDSWIKIHPKRIVSKNYLLFYDFQVSEEIERIARYIANQKKLVIVRLTDGVVKKSFPCDYQYASGPKEFVSLFYYADFVVSSSFHGTAFSIINQKQFYSSQYYNTDRVKSLLAICNLESRFITDSSMVNLNDTIDYSKVFPRIEQEVMHADHYLKASLI